jgi:hypothetical protein
VQGELDADLGDLWCPVKLNPYVFQAEDARNVDTAQTAHVADCQKRYP